MSIKVPCIVLSGISVRAEAPLRVMQIPMQLHLIVVRPIHYTRPPSPSMRPVRLRLLQARLPISISSYTRTLTTTTRLAAGATGDNPIPANDPKPRSPPQTVSETNAVSTSSVGSWDRTLMESVEDAEYKRSMQAPNRKGIWSRSQMPREKAMVGPRFEQMIVEDQVCRSVLCSTESKVLRPEVRNR